MRTVARFKSEGPKCEGCGRQEPQVRLRLYDGEVYLCDDHWLTPQQEAEIQEDLHIAKVVQSLIRGL